MPGDAYRDRHHSDDEIDNRCWDLAIADLAGRQHGVVARRQLAAIGLGRGAIALRLRRGRLHVVHPRVYSVGHLTLTRQMRWMAGALAGGDGAVLSHRAAAAHWGIFSWDGQVEVTATSRRGSRPGLHFHHSYLPSDEVTIHEGIPVTTVPRTLFDLAGVVRLGHLRRAVNEAEIRSLWDRLSLADLLERHPRRPGAAALRAVMATPGSMVTRSDLEDLFLEFLESAGLPRPETNVWIHVAGFWIEVDCVWREQRLIVELDGHATHSTRAAYEHDRARDRRLLAAGWRVMRLTWRQLHDQPEEVIHDLRASLAARPAANLRPS